MNSFQSSIDYLTEGKVSENAYVLTKDGVLCASSLPIQEMLRYNITILNENILVDEKINLLEALKNNGATNSKAGVMLNKEKYGTVISFDQSVDCTILKLKKDNGGACIYMTSALIFIGTFNTTLKMSNGSFQNATDLNKRVITYGEGIASSMV